MPTVPSRLTLVGLAVGLTVVLTAVLGTLHIHRSWDNSKKRFTKQAALSAQIFAESLALQTGENRLRLTQAFVRGDVLYAQVVRDRSVEAEDRTDEALEVALPVEDFSGILIRERSFPDGTRYLEILRPLPDHGTLPAPTELNYVRIGFSLREVVSALQAEIRFVIEVGLVVLLVVGLLAAAYLRLFPDKTAAPRSSPEEASDGNLIRAGPLVIDAKRKEVRLGAQRVDLSPKEYELISVLASEPDRVFSNQELLERVWARSYGATAKDVKQYIYLLRKKLERDLEQPPLIVTVRGFGYKFAAWPGERG